MDSLAERALSAITAMLKEQMPKLLVPERVAAWAVIALENEDLLNEGRRTTVVFGCGVPGHPVNYAHEHPLP